MVSSHIVSSKISVIVAIYNVEGYIEHCVRSLFEQTLTEIEYLFVNDCTPDASMEVLQRVLEDYPERKPWVRIISMPKNSGQAKVREVGIRAATGKYVIHCDSDDWVDTDMYRSMYEKATTEELDIVSCDYCATDDMSYWKYCSSELASQSNFVAEIMSGRVHTGLCNRLIRREIVLSEEILSPKGNMFEDRVYLLQYALRSKRYGHIAKDYYYYRFHAGSICFDQSIEGILNRTMQAVDNVNIIEQILINESLYSLYKDCVVNLKSIVRGYLISAVFAQPKKYLPIWRSIFPEINWRYPFLRSEPFTLRVVFVLTLLGVYPYLRRLIKR